MAGIMTEVHGRTQRREAPGRLRGAQIGTADAVPAGQQDVRDSAHPCSADADEVDARVAIDHEDPFSAAAITSSATCRAACGRPRCPLATAMAWSRAGSAGRAPTACARRGALRSRAGTTHPAPAGSSRRAVAYLLP